MPITRIDKPVPPRVRNGTGCTVAGAVVVILMLMLGAGAQAEDKKGKAGNASEPKTLSGISIMGNNEAPKSLYIVPWKASDLGDDRGLTPSMLDARNAPVDKDVFLREVHYHDLRNSK